MSWVKLDDRFFCAPEVRRAGKYGTEPLHIDHRMPVALGGMSTYGNLQVLCRRCNLTKGAKHPDLWEASA